jgi:hypothetical protein
LARCAQGTAAVCFPLRMSALAKSFIIGALQMHPGDRLRVQDMLLHPWVQSHQVGLPPALLHSGRPPTLIPRPLVSACLSTRAGLHACID